MEAGGVVHAREKVAVERDVGDDLTPPGPDASSNDSLTDGQTHSGQGNGTGAGDAGERGGRVVQQKDCATFRLQRHADALQRQVEGLGYTTRGGKRVRQFGDEIKGRDGVSSGVGRESRVSSHGTVYRRVASSRTWVCLRAVAMAGDPRGRDPSARTSRGRRALASGRVSSYAPA